MGERKKRVRREFREGTEKVETGEENRPLSFGGLLCCLALGWGLRSFALGWSLGGLLLWCSFCRSFRRLLRSLTLCRLLRSFTLCRLFGSLTFGGGLGESGLRLLHRTLGNTSNQAFFVYVGSFVGALFNGLCCVCNTSLGLLGDGTSALVVSFLAFVFASLESFVLTKHASFGSCRVFVRTSLGLFLVLGVAVLVSSGREFGAFFEDVGSSNHATVQAHNAKRLLLLVLLCLLVARSVLLFALGIAFFGSLCTSAVALFFQRLASFRTLFHTFCACSSSLFRSRLTRFDQLFAQFFPSFNFAETNTLFVSRLALVSVLFCCSLAFAFFVLLTLLALRQRTAVSHSALCHTFRADRVGRSDPSRDHK